MKPFVAIFCIFAVAVNAALGGVGGLLLCEHCDGDNHLVSKAQHIQIESHDCCESLKNADNGEPDGCDPCADIEVEGSKVDEAPATLKQSVPKVQLLVSWVCVDFALGCVKTIASNCIHFTRTNLVLGSKVFVGLETTQLLC